MYIPDPVDRMIGVDCVPSAVGPGKISDAGSLMKMEVKVGDKVLYGKYSGTEVSVDDQELLIMRESDILAII